MTWRALLAFVFAALVIGCPAWYVLGVWFKLFPSL